MAVGAEVLMGRLDRRQLVDTARGRAVGTVQARVADTAAVG